MRGKEGTCPSVKVRHVLLLEGVSALHYAEDSLDGLAGINSSIHSSNA